jgi:hypothetical protein
LGERSGNAEKEFNTETRRAQRFAQRRMVGSRQLKVEREERIGAIVRVWIERGEVDAGRSEPRPYKGKRAVAEEIV